MRALLYIVILLAAVLAPADRLDVAKLEPVEAAAVYMEQGLVVLKTDTEAVGKGATAEEALENLKENTPAIIYLDTAEYLLISPEAAQWEEALRPWFKPSVMVCAYNGGDIKEEAKYLDAHAESAKPNN